jgi:mannose-1-phosphate guanylyltransferase
VSEFTEKPSADTARLLIERGGLWNSFIFAAHGKTLLRAFESQCPQLVHDMRNVVTASSVAMAPSDALAALYERLPATDFSRDIVERCAAQLQVIQVPACGWSDLGTPRRVANVIDRAAAPPHQATSLLPHVQGFLDLVTQHMQRSSAVSQESSS